MSFEGLEREQFLRSEVEAQLAEARRDLKHLMASYDLLRAELKLIKPTRCDECFGEMQNKSGDGWTCPYCELRSEIERLKDGKGAAV